MMILHLRIVKMKMFKIKLKLKKFLDILVMKKLIKNMLYTKMVQRNKLLWLKMRWIILELRTNKYPNLNLKIKYNRILVNLHNNTSLKINIIINRVSNNKFIKKIKIKHQIVKTYFIVNTNKIILCLILHHLQIYLKI